MVTLTEYYYVVPLTVTIDDTTTLLKYVFHRLSDGVLLCIEFLHYTTVVYRYTSFKVQRIFCLAGLKTHVSFDFMCSRGGGQVPGSENKLLEADEK